MSELPIELRKLEPVRGALDLIRYLDESSSGAADADDIIDDLSLSDRSFNKVIRRLVTTGYIQMRSDYVYELTQRGRDAARTLAELDVTHKGAEGNITRQIVLTLPRNLVAGETSPLYIGLEPSSDFSTDTEIILQLDSEYADVGDFDEVASINDGAFILETTIAPQDYAQARLKLHVFHLSASGDDLNEVGGMYVDIDVLATGETGHLIGYGADLTFNNL